MRSPGPLLAKLRLFLMAASTLALSACTGPGLSAGHHGGRAFIALAGMLLVTGVILYIALGREE